MKLVANNITLKKEKFTLKTSSFSITKGELVIIIGRSGSGKSSLLKVLSGLEKPTTGVVCRPKSLSYVAQDASLLPWLTVKENILLPYKIKGIGGPDLDKLWDDMDEVLSKLRLKNMLEMKPETLSGGMSQRVIVAQALCNKPDVLLLDEALSAVDQKHKYEIVEWLREYAKKQQLVVVLVTHDLLEALTIADKIFVLSPDGKLGTAHLVQDAERMAGTNISTIHSSLWQKL